MAEGGMHGAGREQVSALEQLCLVKTDKAETIALDDRIVLIEANLQAHSDAAEQAATKAKDAQASVSTVLEELNIIKIKLGEVPAQDPQLRSDIDKQHALIGECKQQASLAERIAHEAKALATKGDSANLERILTRISDNDGAPSDSGVPRNLERSESDAMINAASASAEERFRSAVEQLNDDMRKKADRKAVERLERKLDDVDRSAWPSRA